MTFHTARENILMALKNQIPDYVPCCPDISNLVPAKLTGKPFWKIYLDKNPSLGLAQINAITQLKIDGFSDQGTLDISEDLRRIIKEIIISQSSECIDTKTTFNTNCGELFEITRYYHNQPPIKLKKLIEDISIDYPKIKELFDPSRVSKFRGDYFSLIKSKMGERGIVCLNIPIPGLHWIHEYLVGGIEKAVNDYYTNPDTIRDLCNVLHEYIIEYTKRGLEIGCDCIQIGASGLLHLQSPAIIQDLSLKTLKAVSSLAKSNGIACHLHACGKEKDLVKLVASDTLITSIEPLEPPPMGDCDLEEIKSNYGSRLALKGNIHTTKVMYLGSTMEVKKAVKWCITAAAKEGGYILSTGDQCPAETPIANFEALVHATREFGVY